MTETNPTYEEMREIAEQREKENSLFNFYVADYLATGEGRTIWIMITNNYDRVQSLQDMKEFANNQSIIEYTEDDFLKWYKSLIPDTVKNMMEKKDVPMMLFKQKFYFNYS